MKYGIYPGIDEKTLATISREVEKSKGILRKFEQLDKKVESYTAKVDNKTKAGLELLTNIVISGKKEIENYKTDAIKEMQEDLANAKKDLLEELNKYLISLEDSLKANSDQVFNQILIDCKEKVDQIRLVANNLSGNTTRELLRIQHETEESMNKLKQYVENSSELKTSLQVVKDSEDVMNALLKYTVKEEQINATEAGIILKDSEITTAEEEFMVPKFTMTQGILDPFNRKISYKDRMKKIEEKISELESQGIIIPSALREALPWYLMGKKIVYFYGPTQSGKTTIAELLTKVVETELLDGGKITEEHSITSYNDVRGKFDENALFYSLYYGKTIFYDELDNGNPDNLIVLGTFYSKLVDKIDHPEKNVTVQFAKRRFVPINPNARMIAAGNTTGKARNREYVSRSKMDESSQERLIPIYVGYSDYVEQKIFNNYKDWYNFFKFFRKLCNQYAIDSSMDAAEGNVTTADASTIVECIKEESMSASSLINGIFVQTKEEDYLAYLIKNIKDQYNKLIISLERPTATDYKGINLVYILDFIKDKSNKLL